MGPPIHKDRALAKSGLALEKIWYRFLWIKAPPRVMKALEVIRKWIDSHD